MLRDSLSSAPSCHAMSLSPSVSPSSSPEANHSYSTKSTDSRLETVPIPASHAIELFESDLSSANSPPIAPLVLSSKLPSMSPLTALETAKTKPSTAPASSNATHQKGQTGMNGGRWTEQEHQSFLAGLRLYGREWKKVAAKIKTRTSAQIRSHAQKYFAKLARDDEMRKHSGLPLVASAAPSLGGYFSDGGSSVAQNSGDDEADASDASQRIVMPRSISAGQTKGHSAILIAPMGPAANGLYKPAVTTKKRNRSAVPGYDVQIGMAPSSGYPYKLPKRSRVVDAARVECLPSQEELLARASPNVRHRLSSLIEAELCALQVLSCYALLQQQDQIPASRKKTKRQSRPRQLSTATNSATGNTNTSSALGLSMISTEQIPSASSIY